MSESEDAPTAAQLPTVLPATTRFEPGRSGNPSTRFQPGQSGNPLGSRAKCRFKLSEAFVRELCADFEAHGARAIAEVRERRPQDYLKIVASLVPKQFAVEAEVVVGEVVFRGINDDEAFESLGHDDLEPALQGE